MAEVVPSQPEEKTNFEELPKETLVAMLTQKIKEINNLKGRNSKLETKYINVFKEHKLYKKDHEVMMTFLRIVFSDLPEIALGALEPKELEVMWATRQAQFNEKMRKLMQEIMEARKKEEAEQLRSVEEKITHMDEQAKSLNVQLERRLAESEQSGERMAMEVVRLQNLLSSKEEFLKIVQEEKTKLQHELNSIRVNSVQNELESSFSAFIDTPKENVERTELLMAKQQLERALETNDTLKDTIAGLEAKIRGKNREIELLKANQQHEIAPTSRTSSSNGNGVQKRKSEEEKRQEAEPTLMQPEPLPEQPFEAYDMPSADRSKEFIERQYLKNVFLRFMKCLNEENYPQAEMLESVLMTIMGMNIRERQLATFRRRQWWNIFS